MGFSMNASLPEPTIPQRLFNLAMPVVGLNVLSVLSLAVDTAMCGRLLDAEDALTALGFASQIMFLLLVGMMGLVVGAVAFVARAHGAGHVDRINHIVHQSTILTYIVSFIVAVVGNLAAGTIMTWLGAEDDIRDLGVQYLRPLLTFCVFYYLNMLYAALLRGAGNTRLAFFVALVGNALNIVLNYGLILGHYGLPSLGVVGAAWGTVIAQAFSVVLIIWFLGKDYVSGVRASVRWTKIDRPLAKELFRVGWPAAMDMVILNVAFLSIVGMLGRIAQISVAAHGIGLRIQSLAFVPGLGVAQATGAMVGNALGSGSISEAKQVVRAGVVLSSSIMSAIGLLIIVGAEPIIAVFDVPPGTELARYSVMWMTILGCGMPFVGIHIVLTGMLRGAGATNTSLLINVVGTVALQVPLSWFLGFVVGWGAFGVWVAAPISFVFRMLLGIIAYRRGRWARLGTTV